MDPESSIFKLSKAAVLGDSKTCEVDRGDLKKLLSDHARIKYALEVTKDESHDVVPRSEFELLKDALEEIAGLPDVRTDECCVVAIRALGKLEI